MTTCVQQFISENYDYLSRICVGYIGEELGDDLMHDLCVNILEDNGEKYTSLCEKGELLYYLLGVIRLNAFSKNTRFYYKYIKHTEHETRMPEYLANAKTPTPYQHDDEYIQKQMKVVESLLSGLPWFDCEIFKIYYLDSHSLKSLSDATGISRTTINQALGRARHRIKANKEAYYAKEKIYDNEV